MDPAAPTARVAVVPWPRNERGALAGLKTTSYAENVIALAEAKRRGATEAVFANLAGHLCEGTGTNVFYVVDGELRTPTLASGCLAGVTRGLILEWVGGREVDEPIEVLEQASEIFLASTTRDVQGVARWDDRELEAPGPVTTEALADLAQPRAGVDGALRRPSDVTGRGPCAKVSPRPARDSEERSRAIGAVVARFVHTEEVTGSNPVSPTESRTGAAARLRRPRMITPERAALTMTKYTG